MKRKSAGGHGRRRVKTGDHAQLVLAWYTREAWERLREVADDAQALDETYEAWERGALAAIRDLESIGRRLRKVPVDIDGLIAWCRERHRGIDSAARAEYASYLLRRSEGGGMRTPPPLQISYEQRQNPA
jgi:hypothetical protein